MDMNVPKALFDSPNPITVGGGATENRTEYFFSDQLSAFYNQEQRAIWLRWNPRPRPNFNTGLLGDLNRYCQFLTHTGGEVGSMGNRVQVEYAVMASKVPGVFNLGGDLKLFAGFIENQDRNGLLGYGKACIDVLYRNHIGHGLPITTVSLIQGECLGGGFEAALSSDVLIAERQARFGFPEILFNMFPGMGAYSFLERKVGKRITEELLGNGKIYGAEEMQTLGVIDCVVDAGRGEAEIASFIKSRSRSRNGMSGIAAARRRVNRVEYKELAEVVEVWADTALRLTSRDLKLMHRLVSRQTELRAGKAEGAAGTQLLH